VAFSCRYCNNLSVVVVLGERAGCRDDTGNAIDENSNPHVLVAVGTVKLFTNRILFLAGAAG